MHHTQGLDVSCARFSKYQDFRHAGLSCRKVTKSTLPDLTHLPSLPDSEASSLLSSNSDKPFNLSQFFYFQKKNSSAGAKIERTYTILFLNAICVQASPPCSPRLRCLVFPLGSCLPVIRVKNYPAAASKSELLSLASSVAGRHQQLTPAAHRSDVRVTAQSHCSCQVAKYTMPALLDATRRIGGCSHSPSCPGLETVMLAAGGEAQ